MLQVKKYRAATTRAALEQVKQDLGEEAFVLETKRVQNRKFLGLKSEMQIEISAALPQHAAEKQAATARPAAQHAASTLDLTDAAVAAPKGFEPETSGKDEPASAPAVRRERTSIFSDNAEFGLPSFMKTSAEKIERVEISTEAPRIVNAKKEPVKAAAKTILAEKTTAAEKPAATEKAAVENRPAPVAEPALTSVSSRDFEMLRAELREMKFSLGAFAARQNVHLSHGVIDLDSCGEIFDSPFYESFIELTATGVAPELARKLIAEVIPDYKNGSIAAGELARTALLRGFASRVTFGMSPLETDGAQVMAMIGATGVGKTTTIAKLAARLALHEGRRVELVTLDTYRIAAVEQLKTYAEIIGAGCRVVRSTFELDAALHRMPKDAAVLIDTTGRSPLDLAQNYELSEFLQSRSEIRKCLAIQATTNLQDAVASARKFEMYGADCLAITKMDETSRPGAMLELAAESALPLVYFGTGQRVPEDLQIASPETFAACIFGENDFHAMSLRA